MGNAYRRFIYALAASIIVHGVLVACSSTEKLDEESFAKTLIIPSAATDDIYADAAHEDKKPTASTPSEELNDTKYVYTGIEGYDSYEDIIQKVESDWDMDITTILTHQAEKGLLSDDGEATVILFALKSNSHTPFPVLVIDCNGEVIYKMLTEVAESKYSPTGALDAKFYLCDIDGDGFAEITVHNLADLFGGAGQYISEIYKFENSELTQLFHTGFEWFDTGFYAIADNGFQLTVKNKYTPLEVAFKRERYETPYFDDDGNVPDWLRENNNDTNIRIDSFYWIEPIDIDNDGIYEIMTVQYCSLYGHSDGVGSAYAILKYNVQEKAMEVVKAGFWPLEHDGDDDTFYEQWNYYDENWYK